MTYEQEISIFEELTAYMRATFAEKRHDYGATTTETYEKFGPVSMLVRMHDKIGRLDNLLVNNITNRVVDEKIEDTLFDLANYALIMILEMHKHQLKEQTEAI